MTNVLLAAAIVAHPAGANPDAPVPHIRTGNARDRRKEEIAMFGRTVIATSVLAVFLGLVFRPSMGATPLPSRTAYLTFNRAVQLPGVTLDAGTYAFEIANPNDATDVVRVSKRRHDRTYFLGFTRRVERPLGLRGDHVITFGEAQPGSALPILAWYPNDDLLGREFIYGR